MAKSSGVIRIDLTERPSSDATPPEVPSDPAQPVKARLHRIEVLVAHDATSTTCDQLVEKLGLLDPVRERYALTRASSVQDAGELLKSREFGVALVSLDLLPAPQAAVRFADFALDYGVPVVLVTRSLRWLPASSSHLRLLPWVSPEAETADLTNALDDALAASPLLRNDPEGERKSLGF